MGAGQDVGAGRGRDRRIEDFEAQIGRRRRLGDAQSGRRRGVQRPVGQAAVQFVEIGDVGRRRAWRKISAARPMLDDPFPGQPGQRFAHRRGTEAQFLGQGGGDERFAPAEATRRSEACQGESARQQGFGRQGEQAKAID